MESHVSNWGHSLGLRIPQSIAKMMGLRKGSKVNLKLKDNALVISALSSSHPLEKLAKSIKLATLVKKIRPQHKHELLEDAPCGDEVW